MNRTEKQIRGMIIFLFRLFHIRTSSSSFSLKKAYNDIVCFYLSKEHPVLSLSLSLSLSVYVYGLCACVCLCVCVFEDLKGQLTGSLLGGKQGSKQEGLKTRIC